MLPYLRVVLALGRVAFEVYLYLVAEQVGRPVRLAFAHGGRYEMPMMGLVLYASYHPSPRNHRTGRLTRGSFVDILQWIKAEAAIQRLRKGDSEIERIEYLIYTRIGLPLTD